MRSARKFLLGVATVAVSLSGATDWSDWSDYDGDHVRPPRTRPLPDKIALGYANWGECDVKVSRAAAQGVNVIVWFALSMTLDQSGAPTIGGGPNLTCVGELAANLVSVGLPTTHLISIGGWNGAHPDPAASAEAWWSALAAYDRSAQAAGLVGGFDGIDWDIEGNDTPLAKRNHFPPDELRLMARISELAKAEGKLVAMVPAQSCEKRLHFDR